MREYGQVQCNFWRHGDLRDAGEDARLLALYLLTGPHSNGIGCYYLPDGYVTEDLKWSIERVSQAFAKLSEMDYARRCERTSWVLIPQFLKWNEIANPNVAKSRVKEFLTVPKKSAVYGELCASLKAFGKHWSNDFETVLAECSKQDPTRPEPNQPDKTLPKGAAADPQREQAGEKRKVYGTEEDHALARRIFDSVKVVVPSAKEPNWDAWANAIRLMREQDERTHDEIWTTFDWANRDTFWRANVLSPATLRDRWNQLEAKRLNRPVTAVVGGKVEYGDTGKI